MIQDATSTTPEFRAKVAALLAALIGDGFTPPPIAGIRGRPEAVLFIDMARRHGVALVDADRQRFLIDEVVHHGVLFRLARLRAVERSSAHHQPPAAVWAGLTSNRSGS